MGQAKVIFTAGILTLRTVRVKKSLQLDLGSALSIVHMNNLAFLSMNYEVFGSVFLIKGDDFKY